MSCSLTNSTLIAALALVCACGPGSNLDDDTPTSSGSGTTAATGETGSTGDPSTSAGPATSLDESTTVVADDGPGCGLPPVDDAIVGQLYIYGASQGYVDVGSSTSLSLAWIDFGFPTEVDACVDWSVDAIDGVSIDAAGLLTVGPGVPAGTIITVTADLEAGRRIITTDLEVYEPLESPLVGHWSEILQLPCDGGMPFMPEPTIPELIFYDTGEFTVTWTPFEVYIDYWGTFTHDPGTGALSLTVTGGNYVPADVDGEGTATVVGGELTLEDVWLGTSQDPVTPVACGHVFE